MPLYGPNGKPRPTQSDPPPKPRFIAKPVTAVQNVIQPKAIVPPPPNKRIAALLDSSKKPVKKACSFRLKESTLELLAALASKHGISQTAMLEVLIELGRKGLS